MSWKLEKIFGLLNFFKIVNESGSTKLLKHMDPTVIWTYKVNKDMNSNEKNVESETVYKLTDPNPQLWFLSTLFGLTGIILLIKLVLYSRKVSFLCEHDVWLNVLQILYIQIVVVYFNIATRIKMENTSWTYGMSTRTDFIFLTQEICIPRTTYLQNSQKVLSKFYCILTTIKWTRLPWRKVSTEHPFVQSVRLLPGFQKNEKSQKLRPNYSLIFGRSEYPLLFIIRQLFVFLFVFANSNTHWVAIINMSIVFEFGYN